MACLVLVIVHAPVITNSIHVSFVNRTGTRAAPRLTAPIPEYTSDF